MRRLLAGICIAVPILLAPAVAGACKPPPASTSTTTQSTELTELTELTEPSTSTVSTTTTEPTQSTEPITAPETTVVRIGTPASLVNSNAATTTTVPRTLPFTGSDNTVLAWVGIAFVLLGYPASRLVRRSYERV